MTLLKTIIINSFGEDFLYVFFVRSPFHLLGNSVDNKESLNRLLCLPTVQTVH